MAKLVHVQFLRALAALAIVVHHARPEVEALGLGVGGFADLSWTAGVDVFFVISGFIMVHAARDAFGAPGAWRPFLARRIARVVPLYWALTTLYLAAALAVPQLLNSAILKPWPILASYLFVPFARPDGAVQPVYSLGWTLNYEMFFYGLFALTLGLSRRRAVLALVAGLAALVAAGRLVEPTAAAPRFWTDPILLEFAFGAALGLLRTEGLRLGWLARCLLAAAGLGLLALDLVRPDGALVLPRVLAHGLPAALLVAAAALGEDVRDAEDGPLARFGVALGDASYALYLVHPFVLRAGRELVARSGLAPFLGSAVFLALALIGSVLIALVVHRAFERPMTERVRRFLEGGTAREAVPVR